MIGFLNPTSADLYKPQIDAFRHGLEDEGFVEGQTLTIEYRWGEGHSDRLPQLAADLVRQRVRVIAATGEVVSARAAQSATQTIPIVFTVGSDPVKLGLVASWNNPGGNLTGIVVLASQLVRKQVEMASEIFPADVVLGLMVNPENAGLSAEADGNAAAAQLGRKLLVVKARTVAEIAPAHETLARGQAAALVFAGDPLFLSEDGQILDWAARHRLPTVWPQPREAKNGALVGIGSSVPEAYRQAGTYVGRILKGARPAELPVMQPAKVEVSINLKTAKALGVTLPPALLIRADEVIE